MRTADRRAWTWMQEDVRVAKDDTELFRRKMANVELNLSDLRRAMEKSEEKRDSQFLMRDTVDGIGPWRKESAWRSP